MMYVRMYVCSYSVIHLCNPSKTSKGIPRGVMVKALDYWIVVNEFELHSRYYVHFQTNTLGKDMDLFIPPAMD